MEPLFIEKRSRFEKVSQEAQMPSNEAEWPAAIVGELYKQAPYIEGSYHAEVLFKEKNPESGYSVGSILLTNITTMSTDEAQGPRGQEEGIRTVQIPFIIRAFRLAPLDLLVTSEGKFLPQNRERLRDSMYRPSFTDGTAKGMRWNTWLDTLDRYPLGSLGQVYLESMNAQIVPYEKMSHLVGKKLTGSVLIDAAPFEKTAFRRLVEELNNAVCRESLIKNACFRSVVRKLSKMEPSEEEKLSSLAVAIPPTVTQVMRKSGAVYLVKRANGEAYEPVEEELDRGEALHQLGEDTVRSVDESGMTTVTTSPTVRKDLIEEKIEPIKNFGIYRLKTRGDGREISGWVFPRVVDLDGTTLPMAVFLNGSENAVQKGFAGVRAGSASGVISAKPSGTGIFYRTTGDDAIALIPVIVDTTSQSPDGLSDYDVRTIMGQKAVLHSTPGVVGIEEVEENEYIIPGDMKFAPLPPEQTVELVEEPEEFAKFAKMRRSSLTVRYDYGDQYTLSGCGLDKIADAEHVRVGPEQAVFLMATVGMDPAFAITKLAKVRETQVTTIPNLRPITTLAEKRAINIAKLARSGFPEFIKRLPQPVWLVKEAAVLGDAGSVDKILSLGFINPHNISIFLSYIPDFERTISKICELLFTSRIGDDEDMERASERAMHGLESVLTSLRLIGLEQQTEKDM